MVATQVRLAEELGAEAIRIVATAAIREATNRDEVVQEIARIAGVPVEVLSERGGGPPRLPRRHQDARPSGRGRDRGRRRRRWLLGGRPRHRPRRRARRSARSRSAPGTLTDDFLANDPPSPAEIRAAAGPHRRLLRRGRARPAGPGRRRRRQRHLAAHARRCGARVRDAGAGDPGPRPATRSPRSPSASSSIRAASAPAHRRAPAREALASSSASPCRSARAACARA